MANEEREFSFSTRNFSLGEQAVDLVPVAEDDLSSRTNAIAEDGAIQPDYIPIPDGGVSYWPGDGSGSTLTDEWSGYNGSMSGIGWSSDQPFSEGAALEFADSSDGRAVIGDVADHNFGFSEFTFVVWAKSSNGLSSAGFGDVMMAQGNGFQDTGGFTFYLDDSEGWRFGADSGTVDISLGSGVETGTYKLLAARRRGDTFELLRGGENTSVSVIASQTSSSASVGSSENGLTIGRPSGDDGLSWNNLLYTPRAYNTGLSIGRLDDIRTGAE